MQPHRRGRDGWGTRRTILVNLIYVTLRLPAMAQSKGSDTAAGLGCLVGLAILVGLIYGGYNWLDQAGWITHSHDTPVWIAGDWLVGEYRDCDMRTKTVPADNKGLDSLDKLPRLFCGEDSNGLFDFQRTIDVPSREVQVPAPGSIYLIGVTASELDNDFHVMPVRYSGHIDRTDKWVIHWRCQRGSASLTCNALD